MSSSRFHAPTSGFELDEFVRRLRRTFLVCLALAAAIHLAAVALNPFGQAGTRAPRPMITRFIKREPRLTKPLELRKVPQPKRQLARREVELARARMDQVRSTAGFDTRTMLAAHVATSSVRLVEASHLGALAGRSLEPAMPSLDLTSTRDAEDRIDLALEMLDVNSMDTGRYRAIVIQDAGDKQGIRGFIRLAQVMSSGSMGQLYAKVPEIDRLRDAINEYTGLKADFAGMITYDDPRLLEVPVILPQGAPNEAELEHVAKYLLAGGFVIGDFDAEAIALARRHGSPGSEFGAVLIKGWEEAVEKYGGLVRGQDFWSERLPDHHPIYSAFFDVKGGMPYGFPTSGGKDNRLFWNYMVGYYIKGRLIGVTPCGEGWGWYNDIRGHFNEESTRRLQLAINIVVYALTQEGSITQRLMGMVN